MLSHVIQQPTINGASYVVDAAVLRAATMAHAGGLRGLLQGWNPPDLLTVSDGPYGAGAHLAQGEVGLRSGFMSNFTTILWTECEDSSGLSSLTIDEMDEILVPCERLYKERPRIRKGRRKTPF